MVLTRRQMLGGLAGVVGLAGLTPASPIPYRLRHREVAATGYRSSRNTPEQAAVFMARHRFRIHAAWQRRCPEGQWVEVCLEGVSDLGPHHIFFHFEGVEAWGIYRLLSRQAGLEGYPLDHRLAVLRASRVLPPRWGEKVL